MIAGEEAKKIDTTSAPGAETPCTALIVHPTHDRGILSSIIPTLRDQRKVVIPSFPSGPKVVTLQQGKKVDDVGQLLWRSGIALAGYLGSVGRNSPTAWQGKTVCELGCGCSPLASLVLGAWGARLVFATDGQEKVLDLARVNVATNYPNLCRPPPDLKGTGRPWKFGKLEVAKLDWGDAHTCAILKEAAGGCFDVVCAADVIYDPRGHDVLLDTLQRLGDTRTIYYIAFQVRLHAFEGDFFAHLCTGRGFICEVVSECDAQRVKVVRMTRTPSSSYHQLGAGS